jgi:hypothetical protein
MLKLSPQPIYYSLHKTTRLCLLLPVADHHKTSGLIFMDSQTLDFQHPQISNLISSLQTNLSTPIEKNCNSRNPIMWVHMHTILEGLIDQRVNTRASRGTIRFCQQYLVLSTPKFILKLRRMILVISAFNWVYLYIWFKFCISPPFFFFNVITLS